MATIYRRVGGKKITKVIAMHRTVQDRLSEEALKAGTKAEERLRGHFHSGDSRIVVDEGDVDKYVILDDTRGLRAAMSIEYGRQPDEHGRGGMEGLFILHKAFGLEGGELRP